MRETFTQTFARSPLILTEGAVGQRLEREYGLAPNKDIMYAALIYSMEGRRALTEIYRQYLAIAQKYELPIMLLTNTRRANRERVLRSAYSDKNVMADYADFLRNIAADFACKAYIGVMLGCKNDAYSGNEGLTVDEAVAFHSWQAEQCGIAAVDYLFAGIMPSLDEAKGMAQVMESVGKPYIISLMINRGGTLLDGTTIHAAITAIDDSVQQKPLCYMTNCVHPKILLEALLQALNCTDTVRKRFCGIQANAAYMEAAHLDGSAELQTTTAAALANDFQSLCDFFPVKIMGGCCGTDDTHIEAIGKLCLHPIRGGECRTHFAL